MTGIFLIVLATLFEEVSTSSAKESMSRHMESIASRAFLVGMWGFLFLGLSLLGGVEWKFNTASLPFFFSRVAIEIILTNITLKAITTADRSTFGFFRTLTIPIVLGIDVMLGTVLSFSQIWGILAIVASLFILSYRHALSSKGMGIALLSAIGSSLTLSLYKFDITHFNSVPAEQMLSGLIILPYFLWHAFARDKENPFVLLRSKKIFSESAASGVGGILASFAYLFAPASVIVAVQRSSAVCWSIVAGALHFHEQHIVEKVSVVGLTVIGIILLVR
ncbi:MAG: hypothetical protein AAB400_01845 [Patescibacteria group bacterium]